MELQLIASCESTSKELSAFCQYNFCIHFLLAERTRLVYKDLGPVYMKKGVPLHRTDFILHLYGKQAGLQPGS